MRLDGETMRRATRELDRVDGCHKRPFGSRKAVHASQRTNGKRVRAYFCPACKMWHATTQKMQGVKRLWVDKEAEAA